MSVEAADQKTDKPPKKTLDITAIEKSIDQILLEKTKQKPSNTPIPPPIPTTQPTQQTPKIKTYTPQSSKPSATPTVTIKPEPQKPQTTTIPFPTTTSINSQPQERQPPQQQPIPTKKTTELPPIFSTSPEAPEPLDPNIFHPENSSRPSIYAIKKKTLTQTQPSTKETIQPLDKTQKLHPKEPFPTFLKKIHLNPT